MSIPTPPTKLPQEIINDPESRTFFEPLVNSIYLIWSGIEKFVGFYGTQPVSQGAALTTSNTDSPNSGDATTDAIIANLQTRVDELEARLDSSTGVGLIT